MANAQQQTILLGTVFPPTKLSNELNASHRYLSKANFFTAEQSWHGFAAMYHAMSGAKCSNAINLMGYRNRRGGNTRVMDVRKPVGSWKDAKHSLAICNGFAVKMLTFHCVARTKSDNLKMDLITAASLYANR